MTSSPVTGGQVLILGTGLLGTSIGLGLMAHGRDVVLHDPSPTAQALAIDLGAGRPQSAEDAGDPALVVVAAPPDVTADVVAAALQRFESAVVTDIASVKSTIVRDLGHREGLDLDRYVGGHPLAGSEKSGPTGARGDLFAGRPWVLTDNVGSPTAHARVLDLVAALGGVPVVMDAADHDRAVALVSHVPQVAASLVAARLCDAGESAVALAGQGVRDVTRIAGSDPALWAQILAANAAPVALALRALASDLDVVVNALEALADEDEGGEVARGSRAAVAATITEGNLGRDLLPGKHGAPATRYTVVPVVVPDAPGHLARLLANVGECGVNLEDLRLEHSPGQPVALAEISVVPAAAERLSRELRARGWTVA